MTKTDVTNTDESMPKGDEDAIKVFVRVRPPAPEEKNPERNWCLSIEEERNAIVMKAKPESKIFVFDKVADINITQEAVFSTVGKKIIESCLGGYNGTIFAYGQTGSGKTFTMLGTSEDAANFQHELRGIIPRSFEYLFHLINREIEMHGEKKEFLCKCSFLEIYNEQIFDLLEASSSCLHLREDIKKGVFVNGITEKVVTSAVEAYAVLSSGWVNRRVASTSMNRESSRSHAVFMLQIESKEKKGGIQNVRFSQLNLVDLAGSERQKDTNTVGIRLKTASHKKLHVNLALSGYKSRLEKQRSPMSSQEAGSINRSLSTLGKVIMVLCKSAGNKSKHVSYRESKLTFLLKDSLGGNAKTHLIACAHPSSKCFGETLSTLQFARRAKMIKNKAVVNEDSQGNVSHLQAEVKRLKELLAKFQHGSVPSNPSVSDVPVCMPQPQVNTQSPEDISEWKKNFIQAMLFREKAQDDYRAVQEQLSNVRSLCKKKDQFLMSTKMIVKFRESYIAQLEKAAKTGVSEDIISDRVNNLLEEIKVLKDQLEHNPEKLKYMMENQRLKNEIKKLKSPDLASQVLSDKQRMEELEKIFHELLAAKGAEDEDEVVTLQLSTPKPGDNNVAVAAVEKYKSQIEKLQNEVESLNDKLQVQETASQKALVNAAAELQSYKKNVSELEKVLQARQLKSKIERESMANIHVQTIKSLTPTKTAYTLRSRITKMSRDSPGLNGSFLLEPEEDILQESQPPEMVEQMAEALTDEIKNLQDNNNGLTHRVEEYENDMIKLRQTLSKLENENEQLNEIMSKERNERAKREEDLLKESLAAKEEADKAKEMARISKEEVNDLRVILGSADKELAELKGRSKESIDSQNKDMAVLETKVLQVETELSKLMQENSQLDEDKTMLQEAFDNAQTTIGFHESQLQDLEDLLHTERKDLGKVQNELESTYVKLVSEKEKVAQLQSQVQNEGKEQEAEMLKLMEDVSSLQAQKSNIQNMFDAQSQSLSLLSKELESSRTTMVSQEIVLVQNKEAMRGMLNKIQELKDGWNADKELVISLEAQVESEQNQRQTLRQSCDDQQVKIDNLKVQLNELAEQKERKINNYNVEIDMLRDELEGAMEGYEKLQEELNSRQKLVRQTQEQSDKLAEELVKAKTEVLTLNEEMERLRYDYKQKLDECASAQETDSNLAELYNSQCDEIDRLKENHERFQGLLDDWEKSRQEKNEEIATLKTNLSQALGYKAESESWMSKCKTAEYELESVKLATEEKETELQSQLDKYKIELQLKAQAMTEGKERVMTLSQENDKLQLELVQAQLSVDDLKEDVDRLQCLAAKDHTDKEELMSQLEIIQSENNRINKEMAELQERLKSVEDEHAKLVGHQNLKQKIHFHLALKEENHHLREQVSRLTSELAKFKMLRGSGPEAVLRENVNPCKKTPGKSGQHHGKSTVTPGRMKSHTLTGSKSSTTPSRPAGSKSSTTPSRPAERKANVTPSRSTSKSNITPSKPNMPI